MDACGCDKAFEIFDDKTAADDLDRYRRSGPDPTTRMLVDMIRSVGLRGATLLDIGAGIGVIDHELVGDVADHAVLVDASPHALDAARREASRRGIGDRLEFVGGDFVHQASSIEPADIVTLDRVICCYGDVTSLVRMSATRARALYGLVLPRDRSIVRLWLRILNLWFRLRGLAYRSHVHPDGVVDSLIAEAGLRPRSQATTFIWRVALFERPLVTGHSAQR